MVQAGIPVRTTWNRRSAITQYQVILDDFEVQRDEGLAESVHAVLD